MPTRRTSIQDFFAIISTARPYASIALTAILSSTSVIQVLGSPPLVTNFHRFIDLTIALIHHGTILTIILALRFTWWHNAVKLFA